MDVVMLSKNPRALPEVVLTIRLLLLLLRTEERTLKAWVVRASEAKRMIVKKANDVDSMLAVLRGLPIPKLHPHLHITVARSQRR